MEKFAGADEGSKDSRWKEEMSSPKAGHANVQKAPDIGKWEDNYFLSNH